MATRSESTDIRSESTAVDKVVRPGVIRALVGVAARFSDESPRFDEAALVRRYSALRAWPADGQFGLAVLAWVLGSGFSLREFAGAVNRLEPDFDAAAAAVVTGKTPVGITVGEIARTALRNAAVVVRRDLDETRLYWPDDLSKYIGSAILQD